MKLPIVLLILAPMDLVQATTMREVAQHDSKDSCWSALYGMVYDLTNYAPNHPPKNEGGAEKIYLLCGVDGTKLYDSFHGENQGYLQAFGSIKEIGELEGETSKPTDPLTAPGNHTANVTKYTQIDLKELAEHNSTDDCWVAFHGMVFNMTEYAPLHPGGNSTIWSSCGKDGSVAYSVYHNSSLLATVQQYAIGTLTPPAVVKNDTVSVVKGGWLRHGHRRVQATTMTQVAQHDFPDSCWSALYGTVYDLTDYASSHPRKGGGADNVYLLCGIDGTNLYDSIHGENLDYLSFSSIHELGPLQDEAPEPTDRPTDPLTDKPTETDTDPQTDPPTDEPSDPPTDPPTPEPTSAPTTLEPTDPPTDPQTASTVAFSITVPSDPDPTKYPTTSAPASTQLSINVTVPPPSNLTGNIFDHPRISMSEVALHNTSSDCWVIYGGNQVYNMTEYGHRHPVGEALVFADCGVNGTEAFDLCHDREYLLMIENWKLGILLEVGNQTVASTNRTVGNTTYRTIQIETDGEIHLEELAEHDSPEDCWVAFNGIVFDMTDYAPLHPAGPESIWSSCGTDGSIAYSVYHDNELLMTVQQYIIGSLVVSTEVSRTGEEEVLPPQDRPSHRVTSGELRLHNESTDCWILYYTTVYDMTHYFHPDPKEVNDLIRDSCGCDGTRDFSKVHSHALLKSIKMLEVGHYKASLAITHSMLVTLAAPMLVWALLVL